LARAAARAKEFLDIEPLPAVLTVREAHAAQSYVVPPMHLTRESAPGACQRAISAAPHRLQGSFVQGGQEQFYLEGQISYAVPLEGDGMRVHCSTQHPSEMQQVVSHALGTAAHATLVECRRMGGGFGISAVRLHRRGGGTAVEPAGQAAPRPRRRLHDHRSTPRLRVRLRRRL
jgi:xanthine dehydrogenase large subunit